MLKNLNETSQMISDGKLLHIAGNSDLLKRLPKGNWIGGSIEYFMTANGGIVSDNMLFVNEMSCEDFKISVYDEKNIQNITDDTFENGYSVVILPFDSPVHKEYAKRAPEFKDIFIKNIVGWVSGINLSVEGQIPSAMNGLSGESYVDKAVVLHISIPKDKIVNVGIINIFEPDKNSPLIEFENDSFSVETCKIDGKEMNLSKYLHDNDIDTKLPLIGDYSGVGVNISFKLIENGVVNFYAPVFKGIQYQMAKPVANYAEEFKQRLQEHTMDNQSLFSCNCILNFLYGELEGKKIETFFGPVTFGEVAYQLVNQTLVYVTL